MRGTGARRKVAARIVALAVAFLGLVPGQVVVAASPTPVVGPLAQDVCGPVAPGFARCLALRRTDLSPFQALVSGYGPTELQSAYALTAASATLGSGLTVAVVDAFDLPTAEHDLGVYRAQFGLSPCTTANGCFRKVNQDGGTTYPTAPDLFTGLGWGQEIALDIDMVSAICPRCKILLVEADSDSMVDLGTAVNRAVAMGAHFVSNSYGGPEFGAAETAVDATYFDHPGVAITVASGDCGYRDNLSLCQTNNTVEYPAASAHVVAVGGTRLVTSGTARGWSETAWSGAGSGCSSVIGKPSWQVDAGCARRMVTDVSAVADPNTGVASYDSSYPSSTHWFVLGGTSVATPIIASAYALAGTPTDGTYPGSYLYDQTGLLNDVTSGANGSCASGPAYLCTAGAGYDGPTGLGTPSGIGAFTDVPTAPTGVEALAGNASADVTWSAPPSDGGSAITGYTATSLPGGLHCDTSGALGCTVTGLTNGTSYTFTVRAFTTVGLGAVSGSSAPVVPMTVPDAPASVAAEAGNETATVTWTAPPSDGGNAVKGYTVTSFPDGRQCTTTGALECTVTSLTNGTPYTFTVTATNDAGTGAPAGPTAPVTPDLTPTPSIAPLRGLLTAGSVALSWGATGPAPAASYDVRYRRAPWNGAFGGYAFPWSATPASGATFVTAAGNTYCFSVRARSAGGSVSGWTAETCTAAPLDDRGLSRSSGWLTGTGTTTSWYLGTYARSSIGGAKLVRTGVWARRISILVTSCKGCGSISVYWGSTLLRNINLNTSTTIHRRLITAAVFTSVRHGTLTIRVRSPGHKVLIDGVAISRA